MPVRQNHVRLPVVPPADHRGGRITIKRLRANEFTGRRTKNRIIQSPCEVSHSVAHGNHFRGALNATHLSRIPIPIPAADASLQRKPERRPVVGDCAFHIETVTVAPTFAVVFHKVGTGHVAACRKLFEMPSHFLFIVGQAMP